MKRMASLTTLEDITALVERTLFLSKHLPSSIPKGEREDKMYQWLTSGNMGDDTFNHATWRFVS